jgi:hypothetical protein
MSSLPKPVEITCTDIANISPSYKLEFKVNDFYYIVKKPTIYDTTQLDKVTPALAHDEILGDDDGIYTWLLFDRGEGSPKEIVSKKTLDITEINTKHTNILQDICSGRDTLGSVKSNVIRVYFGGEMKKETFKEKIVFSINFSSGSYSLNQIDPINFSLEIEKELTELILKQFCGEDNACRNSIEVNILRNDNTLINSTNGLIRNIEQISRLIPDAKVYRFPTIGDTKYKRALNMATVTYKAKLDLLSRMYSDKTSETYNEAKKKLDEEFKPLTESELQNYLLTSGGRKNKTRKNKTRKNKTRKNKTRKNKTRKNKRKK